MSLPYCFGCNKCRPGDEQIEISSMIKAYMAMLTRPVDMYSFMVAFSSDLGENNWNIFVLGHTNGQFMHGYFKHDKPLPMYEVYQNQDYQIRWYCGPKMDYIKSQLGDGQNVL